MIAKESVNEFLARKLDSFNWMKQLSREELLEAFIDFRPLPEFKTSPWNNQLVCFHIGLACPGFLFMLDMAGGKTKIAIDLMSYRKSEGKLKQSLVIASRDLTTLEWVDEIAKHSDLSVAVATGSIQRKREVLESDADILVTSYQGLTLAICEKGKSDRQRDVGKTILKIDEKRLERLCRRVNFVVFDEIHHLRNSDSVWYRICRRIAKRAEYRYGLTGTPHGRDLQDLWPVFYLCDLGETLGETLGLYRAAFFDEVPGFRGYPDYRPRADAEALIHRVIQHRSIRYSEDELGDLPERIDIQIRTPLTAEQREHYLRAVKGLVSASGNLQEMDNAFVRMRQITAGFLSWTDEYGSHNLEFDSIPKVEAVLDLVSSMPEHEKMIVFCDFVETGRLLHIALTKHKCEHKWVYGGNRNSRDDVEHFKRAPTCRVLIANSILASESLNLQVAGYVVFYESPVSPITRFQAEKRSRRPGRKDRVRIYDLVAPGTTDVRILGFIQEGRDLKSAILDGTFDVSELTKDFDATK